MDYIVYLALMLPAVQGLSDNVDVSDGCDKSLTVTLDRVEGDVAVLLVRSDENVELNLPLTLMPAGSKEGDILDITISRNERATEESRQRISALLLSLNSSKSFL